MMESKWKASLCCATWLLVLAIPTGSTFQLDSLKSLKLIQLYLNRTLTLQFEYVQKNQTEFDLFTIEEHEGRPIFRIFTSTVQNIIGLDFQLANGRRKHYKIACPFLLATDQFHKIHFVLNGRKIFVAENCRQLLFTEDNELAFSQFLPNELHLSLGPKELSNAPNLREFSADTVIQPDALCPNMESLADNIIAIEYSNSQRLQEDKQRQKEVKRETTDFGQQQLLLERVNFLERQISHWNSLFNHFEGRMHRVELHQRGCKLMDGKQLQSGERVQNQSECTECQCGLDAQLHCKPIGCPALECTHPVKVDGECCPKCGRRCLYNGNYYESGEVFWPKECTHCLCNNGKMECGFKFPQHCPPLDCPQQETLPNQCCPVCVNIDHCASGRNPCSAHATCKSGRHSAICQCKDGFFGNGTLCTDIDECLWDKDARKQLGGCGEGTVCINLPGTFKCECLPGYQKLDAKNCLDVIRI